MSGRAIRSVAVLGGGITGLSAALAFARALPQAQVTLIRTLPDPAALADRMPGSLPSITRFHEAIGLSEAELIGSGAASWRLGTRFENWSADGAPWIHVHGDYGLPAGVVPFHQIWAEAKRQGDTRPYHAYSAGAVLADAGLFVHESDPRSPLSTYDYALRLDPERYARLLAAKAADVGIAAIDGSFAGIDRRPDGGVAALLLADGRRVEADLYLDCAGPDAPLLSALDSAFEDWSACLPCDRLVLATAPTAEPSSRDTVRAIPDGWTWTAPLPDRTLTGLAYSSGAEHDARTLEGEHIPIRPGRRPHPWIGNVLAIGDAAVALDPLVSANLHLAQSTILRALDLLPGRDCDSLELREYDRRTSFEVLRVRDFAALHYLRSARREGTFWQKAGALQAPDTLAHTLHHFESRGRLPFHEEESFTKESWLAVLLGMGVMPRHIDPVAMAAMGAGNMRVLDAFADDLARLPPRLPGYRDYLRRAVTART